MILAGGVLLELLTARAPPCRDRAAARRRAIVARRDGLPAAERARLRQHRRRADLLAADGSASWRASS